MARRLPRRLPLWRAILWREWPSDHLRLRHGPHCDDAGTALATLLILGDDLSGVDRAATLRHVRALQQADGSFRAFDGGESDMRFVYCAAAICAMLRDGGGAGEDLGEEGSSLEWEGMDAALASSYVLGSQAYDGALGLGPGMESHGGSTYTGLSALALMGYLPQLQKIDSAIFWCKARQIGGFQGAAKQGRGHVLQLLDWRVAPFARRRLAHRRECGRLLRAVLRVCQGRAGKGARQSSGRAALVLCAGGIEPHKQPAGLEAARPAVWDERARVRGGRVAAVGAGRECGEAARRREAGAAAGRVRAVRGGAGGFVVEASNK